MSNVVNVSEFNGYVRQWSGRDFSLVNEIHGSEHQPHTLQYSVNGQTIEIRSDSSGAILSWTRFPWNIQCLMAAGVLLALRARTSEYKEIVLLIRDPYEGQSSQRPALKQSRRRFVLLCDQDKPHKKEFSKAVIDMS